MRRLLAFALTLALLGVPVTVAAQTGLIGPAGIIYYSTASTTVVNSTSNVELLSIPIPIGLVATSAVTSPTTVNFRTPAPISLVMSGTLNAAANAQPHLGVSFGGSLATITLLNGTQNDGPALTNVPVEIRACLSPIATKTATPTNTNTVLLSASWATFPTTNIPGTSITAQVIGTPVLASTNNLNVGFNWAAASNSNRLTIYRTVVAVGGC